MFMIGEILVQTSAYLSIKSKNDISYMNKETLLYEVLFVLINPNSLPSHVSFLSELSDRIDSVL